MTFLRHPRCFWITILLNGERQFLLTCKVNKYRTMLLFKCKMHNAQGSQEGCYDFSKTSTVFLDNYTLEWRKAVSAYL